MKNNSFVVFFIMMLMAGCSGTMPDLGINGAELLPCPEKPNCVNSQATGETHYIKPIRYTGAGQEARNRLLEIIESEKRTNIVSAQENYIRVEFTSAVFRFVDDVEFYFPQKDVEGKIIHVRSASRLGYSDLGANRKRVERIRRKMR